MENQNAHQNVPSNVRDSETNFSSKGLNHTVHNLIRCYFYNIDLHGRLFLEETSPKNVATCLKDTKFLNFFFKQIRSIDDEGITVKSFMKMHGIPSDHYPYVSLCGSREYNFIRPATKPFVFHSMEINDSDSFSAYDNDAKNFSKTTHIEYLRKEYDTNSNATPFPIQGLPSWSLQYGGNLTQQFDPTHLRISKESGRLYHKITNLVQQKKKLAIVDSKTNGGDCYGLIRSSVAVILSEYIVQIDTNTNDNKSKEEVSTINTEIIVSSSDCCSGLGFTVHFSEASFGGTIERRAGVNRIIYSIPWLLNDYEPDVAKWAAPHPSPG